MSSRSLRPRLLLPFLVCVALSWSCGSDGTPESDRIEDSVQAQAPPPPPAAYLPIIGEYATGTDTLSILEDGQALFVLFWKGGGQELVAATDSTFTLTGNGGTLTVRSGSEGRVNALALGTQSYEKLRLGGEEGSTFQITPLRPAGELLEEALAATPTFETGDFLDSIRGSCHCLQS